MKKHENEIMELIKGLQQDMEFHEAEIAHAEQQLAAGDRKPIWSVLIGTQRMMADCIFQQIQELAREIGRPEIAYGY